MELLRFGIYEKFLYNIISLYSALVFFYVTVRHQVTDKCFCFMQVVSKVAQGIGETQEVVLNKMLDVWLDKMALVTQLERRKLLGLSLASLLTAQSRYLCLCNTKAYSVLNKLLYCVKLLVG
jgi:hypothetical protein